MKKFVIAIGLMMFLICGIAGAGQLPNPSGYLTLLTIIGGIIAVIGFYMKKPEQKSDWPSISD